MIEEICKLGDRKKADYRVWKSRITEIRKTGLSNLQSDRIPVQTSSKHPLPHLHYFINDSFIFDPFYSLSTGGNFDNYVHNSQNESPRSLRSPIVKTQNVTEKYKLKKYYESYLTYLSVTNSQHWPKMQLSWEKNLKQSERDITTRKVCQFGVKSRKTKHHKITNWQLVSTGRETQTGGRNEKIRCK